MIPWKLLVYSYFVSNKYGNNQKLLSNKPPVSYISMAGYFTGFYALNIKLNVKLDLKTDRVVKKGEKKRRKILSKYNGVREGTYKQTGVEHPNVPNLVNLLLEAVSLYFSLLTDTSFYFCSE